MSLAASFANDVCDELTERACAMVAAIFKHCRDHGYPLTDEQKVAIASAQIYAFEGFRETVEALLTVRATVEGLCERLGVGSDDPITRDDE